MLMVFILAMPEAHPLAHCVAFVPMLQLCVGFELVHVHAAVTHKHLGKEEVWRLLVDTYTSSFELHHSLSSQRQVTDLPWPN